MTSELAESLRSTSFERLHLRRNPFGELSRSQRAQLACVDLTEMAAFLRESNRAVQLVADHGRGKSTHLIALQASAFPDAPYTQLRASEPAPVPGRGPQFIDSLENLGWLGRRRLFRKCESLACTTHRDLTSELRRAGFDVLTVRVGIDSVTELEAIVHARVEGAALGTGAPPYPARAQLKKLYETYGDDVRGIEEALYHRYEALRRSQESNGHG